MKALFSMIFVAIGLVFANLAIAQVYPYTTPTYIPNAVGVTKTIAAPSASAYTLNTANLAVTSLRVTGTCTALAATLQGSNDGTNWSNLTLHPVTASSGVTTPVVSIAAPGFWRNSAAGFTSQRLNVSALTASGTNCTVTMTGTQASGALE